MAFFRIKKIKGKEYAYFVENEWMKSGSRQKVKKYIGRVYRFDIKNDIDFLQFADASNLESYVNVSDFKKIVSNLIEWELFKFGIDRNKFSIELNSKNVQNNKKDVSLMLNDGFMCELTLKNLVDFEAEGDESRDGYRLARAFVEAGIKVPQEIFVGLFGKLYKQTA